MGQNLKSTELQTKKVRLERALNVAILPWSQSCYQSTVSIDSYATNQHWASTKPHSKSQCRFDCRNASGPKILSIVFRIYTERFPFFYSVKTFKTRTQNPALQVRPTTKHLCAQLWDKSHAPSGPKSSFRMDIHFADKTMASSMAFMINTSFTNPGSQHRWNQGGTSWKGFWQRPDTDRNVGVHDFILHFMIAISEQLRWADSQRQKTIQKYLPTNRKGIWMTITEMWQQKMTLESFQENFKEWVLLHHKKLLLGIFRFTDSVFDFWIFTK